MLFLFLFLFLFALLKLLRLLLLLLLLLLLTAARRSSWSWIRCRTCRWAGEEHRRLCRLRRCSTICEHPGVFRTAALAGVHHEAPLSQGDPRKPTSSDPNVLTVAHREGAKVEMPRLEPASHVSRRGRKPDHRLSNP